MEYTVITRENFNRLIQQYKTRSQTCNITFTDKLELNNLIYPVISGTRPVFNGYYYLLARKSMPTTFVNNTILVYGNSNNGRMDIGFMVDAVYSLGE